MWSQLIAVTKTAAGKEASDSSAAAKEFRRSASLKGKRKCITHCYPTNSAMRRKYVNVA